jgi:hypothetical protein
MTGARVGWHDDVRHRTAMSDAVCDAIAESHTRSVHRLTNRPDDWHDVWIACAMRQQVMEAIWRNMLEDAS